MVALSRLIVTARTTAVRPAGRGRRGRRGHQLAGRQRAARAALPGPRRAAARARPTERARHRLSEGERQEARGQAQGGRRQGRARQGRRLAGRYPHQAVAAPSQPDDPARRQEPHHRVGRRDQALAQPGRRRRPQRPAAAPAAQERGPAARTEQLARAARRAPGGASL